MRLREEIVKASRIHQLKISGNDLLHLHNEKDEEETDGIGSPCAAENV